MSEWGVSDWAILGTIAVAAGALITIGIWVGGMNSLKDTVKEIKGSISRIEGHILSIFEKLPPQTTSTGSPIRLTDLGRTVSSELGAADWAKDHANGLINEVRGKPPYEIQEFCFEYVTGRGRGFLDSEERWRQVNSCAYNHGIETGQVLRVVGIELRDALLELLGLHAP